MAWYCQRKLQEISTKIGDSLSQLKAYCEQKHVVDRGYFDFLGSNIETVIVPEQMEILENTANIVAEMKALVALEEKRRTTHSQLTQREKKGVVKKGRIEKRKNTAQRGLNPYEKHRIPPISGSTSNESVADQPTDTLREETEQPIPGTSNE